MMMMIEKEYVGDDWFVAEWPDGTWCNWDERHGMTHMSDDYHKACVLSYDESYTPVRTERVPQK